MARVFISYRRSDSAPWAGRLCDRLSSEYGADNVFMDVEDIPAGADFQRAIERTIIRADVLIAVIGPQWLTSLRERAGERDLVREEIAAALRRGVTVVPVLAGGAALPSETELPPELSGLATRQALRLRDEEFRHGADELVRVLRSTPGRSRSSRRIVWSLLAVALAIAIGGAAVLLSRSRERLSLDGVWMARMQSRMGQYYSIRLELQTEGEELSGRVEYPTGSAAIQGGVVNNGRISFFTQHIPQFESERATLRISGLIRGSEIDLSLTSPDGAVTRGTARKVE